MNTDYDFGAKRHWRRWSWNRIVEKSKDPSSAKILFLAGEDAFDIDVATQKGFSADNMIAVEWDKLVAEKLKASGILTIQGDLNDVLWAWNSPIDVVVGDYCGGCHGQILKKLVSVEFGCLYRRCFAETTFAFNFQRGRESGWNKIASLPNVGTESHRGRVFYGHYKHRALSDVALDPECTMTLSEADSLMDRLCCPQFSDYKSVKGMHFDSVVFRSMASGFGMTPEQFENSFVPNPLHHIPYNQSEWNKMCSLRRKIAANKAHHTRRIQSRGGFSE